MWYSTCFKLFKSKVIWYSNNVHWFRRYCYLLPLRFWFLVLQYHIWLLLCIKYKWHWWDANQNLLLGHYTSTLICQNYKTREKSKIILSLGKYPTGERSRWGNVQSEKSPLEKCLVGESSSRGGVCQASVSKGSVLREFSVWELFYNPLHIS